MMHLRRLPSCYRCGALVALVSACVAVSGVAAAATEADAARTSFRVALKATMTKTWSYSVQGEADGCPTLTRVQGRRTVILRSSRPSLVTVYFSGRRVRYAPAVVRFLAGGATQAGTVRTEQGQPPSCTPRSVRIADCVRARRSLAGKAARFYRSGWNEISFARTPDFAAGFQSRCPPQTASVRAERPGLHLAEGEISEADLRNPRVLAQTASGSTVETTDFEGDGDGKVVVRVSWELTFSRVG